MIKVNLWQCILAPMAGITGYPFRKIALKCGADFSFTEMISAAEIYESVLSDRD